MTELFEQKKKMEIRKNSSLNIRLHSLFQFKSMLLPYGLALPAKTVFSVVSRKASQIP